MDGGRVKSEQKVLKVGQDFSVTTMVPTGRMTHVNKLSSKIDCIPLLQLC